MKPELQVFTNCEGEPFAVCYFGTNGYGLTKEAAIEAYNASGWFEPEPYEDGYDCSEPKIFYMREDVEEWGEEGYHWQFCNADHPKAVVCFGCVF